MISRKTAQQSVNIFDKIRSGFAYVAEHADHVRINDHALKEFTLSVPNELPDNVFDENHHFIGTPEQTAAYVLTLDAMNFGSGFEPELVKEGWERVDESLYFTIATRLKQRFDTDGPMASSALEKIGIEDTLQLLKLNKDGAHSFEFARLCALSLRELGAMISNEFSGSFLGFVESTGEYAANCVEKLASLDGFCDVHTYKERDIHILKRAQSTAADLNDAFIHMTGEGLYTDLDKLTILPDNDIPRVLRTEGVLEYSDELAAIIDGGQPVESGTGIEIELRTCAAHAVEKMAEIKALPVIHLDRILWHKCAEEPKYKKQPAHRTKSRFY